MEKFDLYDVNRQKTSLTVERGQQIPDRLNRSVVHIALFGSDGRMLIQRRQKDKSSWADLWDFSVGGHVISGETSSLCAQRELKEELGIEYDFSDIRPSFTLNFETGFDDYYIICCDVNINEIVLQEEEVQDVRWADKEEIALMIDDGSFIPYKKSVAEMLFEMKDGMGAHKV